MESFLRGSIGLFLLVVLLFALSTNRKAISWKLVFAAILMQFMFALSILKIPQIASFFEVLSTFFVVVLSFTKQGSSFLFGKILNVESNGFIFAFQILPTIIFFSALTSVLFYLGILQKIVYGLSWVLGRFLNISGPENLSASANIFLGQTEAPLLIKPYLEGMTKSEIFCVMVGGMASSAGGVLAAYVGFLGGSDSGQQLFFAKHLLAASVMSAPAAIAVSKILLPQDMKIDSTINLYKQKSGSNLIEAISIGTEDGLKLALNVGSMLLVFIALIAMVNYILGELIGGYSGLNFWVKQISNGNFDRLSLQFLLGYLCSPFVWALGVTDEDMVSVGRLLGEKLILNEFVAYMSLGEMKAKAVFHDPKSLIMATYILSGFANFSSIGIQVGGIGSLAPSRKSLISELGIKALIGGTICSLMTATIIGMLS
ncbi:MAG: NupC/NupG family nucleoside CNT transporter [Bacteriovoracaceae bacterium]